MDRVLKKIIKELELVVSKGINYNRAIDLLEASTKDLREIIALNTLRETIQAEKSNFKTI